MEFLTVEIADVDKEVNRRITAHEVIVHLRARDSSKQRDSEESTTRERRARRLAYRGVFRVAREAGGERELKRRRHLRI